MPHHVHLNARLFSLAGLAAGTVFLFAPAATAVTLLNDNFSSGVRNVQNLPSQSAWFAQSSGSNLTVVSQHLNWAANGGFIVSYFTASGSPQNLNIGDTLTLSYTLSFATVPTGGNNFRLALLNSSNGARATADNQSASGTGGNAYTNYSGYLFTTNLASSSGSVSSIQERSNFVNSGSNLLMSVGGTSAYVGLGTTGGNNALSDGVSYTGTLSLNLVSASQMDITHTINGFTFTRSDTVSPFTSFDTVAFNIGTSTVTIDDISVVYTPVPEPSTLALTVLGGLAGIFCLCRRRS